MLRVFIVSILAVAMVLAAPNVPEKQIVHYENTILHKGAAAEPVQKINPVTGGRDSTKQKGTRKLADLLDEINSYPEYEFAYGVKDPVTGDHKDQWEKRVGDHVQGVYMFEEADGTQRIVEYEADDQHGFQAKVTNVGHKQTQLEQAVKAAEAQQNLGTVATSYNMLNKAN